MKPASAAQDPGARKTFREAQFVLREEAILDACHRLLARKGYEAMSMDDIATEVGVAKGSLYKHFESKEALAGAVMTRLLVETRGALQAQGDRLPALARLRALLHWSLRKRLAGGVPHLPSTSRSLQQALVTDPHYLEQLTALSEAISHLIRAAKATGELDARLRDEFILYTLYARTCDPTLDFLQSAGAMSDDEIVDHLTRACFEGLAARSP